MLTPSRSATLHNIFVGDGYYDLCLRIGELITLQEATQAGPQFLANRIANNEWMVGDITHTIRLALIGGGLDPQSAYKIVTSYVREGYLFDFVQIAHTALWAALSGVADEPNAEEADAESDDPFLDPLITDESAGAI